MPDIEVKKVTKRFGVKAVVDGLSLCVRRGQGLGLFGPSGSGKTTVLRLIAGLERPDSGTVLVDNSEVSVGWCDGGPGSTELGMVFQDLALWPHMRAERHLEFVLRGRGMGRRERKERARDMLDFCGLGDKRYAHPATLSGGEQQRLAIARALVTRPNLILLDEPFANLDDALRRLFLEELLRRKKEQGVTLVIASHDRGDFDGITDCVLEMPRGLDL